MKKKLPSPRASLLRLAERFRGRRSSDDGPSDAAIFGLLLLAQIALMALNPPPTDNRAEQALPLMPNDAPQGVIIIPLDDPESAVHTQRALSDDGSRESLDAWRRRAADRASQLNQQDEEGDV